jgi:hypothetical protein
LGYLQDELVALESIFGDDFRLPRGDGDTSFVRIRVRFLSATDDSSASGADSDAFLTFGLPALYPIVPPTDLCVQCRAVSRDQRERIGGLLLEAAIARVGEPMVYALFQLAHDMLLAAVKGADPRRVVGGGVAATLCTSELRPTHFVDPLPLILRRLPRSVAVSKIENVLNGHNALRFKEKWEEFRRKYKTPEEREPVTLFHGTATHNVYTIGARRMLAYLLLFVIGHRRRSCGCCCNRCMFRSAALDGCIVTVVVVVVDRRCSWSIDLCCCCCCRIASVVVVVMVDRCCRCCCRCRVAVVAQCPRVLSCPARRESSWRTERCGAAASTSPPKHPTPPCTPTRSAAACWCVCHPQLCYAHVAMVHSFARGHLICTCVPVLCACLSASFSGLHGQVCAVLPGKKAVYNRFTNELVKENDCRCPPGTSFYVVPDEAQVLPVYCLYFDRQFYSGRLYYTATRCAWAAPCDVINVL